MSEELKEPVKWDIYPMPMPRTIFRASDDGENTHVGTADYKSDAVDIVNAHNSEVLALYSRAVTLRDERDKLKLELAQLRQLIEQDAKAREMQSEAERKVGGV